VPPSTVAARNRDRSPTQPGSLGLPAPSTGPDWSLCRDFRDSGERPNHIHRCSPGGNRVYAGAANGGVWFSANGGSDWSPLDDYTTSPSVFAGSGDADSLAIGAIAVRFGAGADEVFVGTGEFNPAYDAYFGVGIRHLASGAWTLEATNLGQHSISSIVIDPNDPTPTHVLAATNAGIIPPTSYSAIHKLDSSNPAAAFTNSSGTVSDLIIGGSWRH